MTKLTQRRLPEAFRAVDLGVMAIDSLEQAIDVGEICEASMRIVQPKALDNQIAISGINGVALPRRPRPPAPVRPNPAGLVVSRP